MSHSTPNTEFSPPSSPQQKYQQIMKDTRLSARRKLAQLTLEEKVLSMPAKPFLPKSSLLDPILMPYPGLLAHCRGFLEDAGHSG